MQGGQGGGGMPDFSQMAQQMGGGSSSGGGQSESMVPNMTKEALQELQNDPVNFYYKIIPEL